MISCVLTRDMFAVIGVLQVVVSSSNTFLTILLYVLNVTGNLSLPNATYEFLFILTSDPSLFILLNISLVSFFFPKPSEYLLLGLKLKSEYAKVNGKGSINGFLFLSSCP